MRPLARASILLAVAAAGGCGTTSSGPSAGTPAVELKPVTAAELDKFVADQKGKVVLLDCWSLT